MLILSKINDLTRAARGFKQDGKVTGFVPTMGALHQGHLSLIKESLQKTDITVVSIFINPTQFSPDEDFDKYPKQVEKDILLLKKMGVHLLFTPESSNMYTEKKETSTIVDIPYLSNLLCGQSRPVLFQGVCTVVCKLFNIVTPDKAFFGEKDFQQLVIIKKITRDLFFPVEIVACKTAREKDGLALSSRNIYLSESERKIAPEIYKTLLSGQHMFQSGIIESEKLL